VLNDGVISKDMCDLALKKLNIDAIGLDAKDYSYLLGIIDNFEGGPVGLDSLAASIGEESTTIEDVYEPYLLQIGFIKRTPRGRVATPKAFKHLKKKHNMRLF
jgi:Holliday junction DNA helicase RuvB